jgi:hypothetical protein
MDLLARYLTIHSVVGEKGNMAIRVELDAEILSYAAELAGPTPTPAERLLADVASLDWHALQTYQSQFASRVSSDRPFTIAQSDHLQSRIDRAHQRLMRSLKTLAIIRRLAVPIVQFNLGHQQVNVAGPAAIVASTTGKPDREEGRVSESPAAS